ncbi:50S ribosomal protein L11 methyltransferase [Bacillus sp. SL00103]
MSEKFTIVPTWGRIYAVHSDELIIEMDPEWHLEQGHPTTVLCIQALERYVKEKRYGDRCWNSSGIFKLMAANGWLVQRTFKPLISTPLRLKVRSKTSS